MHDSVHDQLCLLMSAVLTRQTVDSINVLLLYIDDGKPLANDGDKK